MIRGNRTKYNMYDDGMSNSVKEEITEIIENQSPAYEEVTGPETKNGIIENSLFVKVRKTPSFESDVIEVLRKGDRVIILGKEGSFYKVSTSVNKLAYISSDFVKEE